MELDPQEMAAVVRRLKRAQGQIGGVISMIESGRACDDIVIQLAAVSKALDRAGFATISTGLRACLAEPDARETELESLQKLFLSFA